MYSRKRNSGHGFYTKEKKKRKQEILPSQLNEILCEEPKIIGAFTVDQHGNYENSMNALKYLKIPKDINFNLKEKYQEIKSKNDEITHDNLDRIKKLTQFIKENSETVIKEERVDADFVCFRGVLRYILASFYDRKEFDVQAVKFKGTIYMALITKSMNEASMDEESREKKEYGFLFENFILSSNPRRYPSKKKIPERNEFCVVMSRKVDKFNIVFGAECDGVKSKKIIESSKDLEISQLIEIKQRSDIPMYSESWFKDYKKLEWWCQSFIASIGKIVFGKRDANGIIKSIEEIDVGSLENPEHSKKFWHKNVCLNRLSEFLDKIKTDMENIDDPKKVFSFKWNGTMANFNIKARETNLPEGQEFLPEDYIKFINNLNN